MNENIKVCPLTRNNCRDDCAWYVYDMCAIKSIAEEIYANRTELELIKERIIKGGKRK